MAVATPLPTTCVGDCSADEAKKALLLADDAVFQEDFLDEVASDLPKGCWSI